MGWSVWEVKLVEESGNTICCECSAVFIIHMACGCCGFLRKMPNYRKKNLYRYFSIHQPYALHGTSRYIHLHWVIALTCWQIYQRNGFHDVGMNQDPIFSWITPEVFPRGSLHTFDSIFLSEHVHFFFGQGRQPENQRKRRVQAERKRRHCSMTFRSEPEIGDSNESNISQGLSQNRECVEQTINKWDFGVWHFGTTSFKKQTWARVCNQYM